MRILKNIYNEFLIYNLELRTLDELFTTQDERDNAKREKITDIPLAELHPFKNHPFRVEEDDELRELARSIAEHGVVTPAIARPAPAAGTSSSSPATGVWRRAG